MKRALLSAVLSGAVMLSTAPVTAIDFHAVEPPDAANRYIVVLREGRSEDFAGLVPAMAQTYTDALRGFAASLTTQQLDALKNDPRVAFVEPDHVVTTFSHLTKQPAQVLPTGIRRSFAMNSVTAKMNGVDEGLDVDVAVIDTGVDLTHSDLHVFRNVNFISSFRNGDDDNGHGTHVAGTIAARDNAIGVVGVAPGARIWAVKVLDRRGSGYMSDIVEGLDYVTQHADEIEVANMSLGCECVSAALDQAIDRAVNAGVIVVVAAGNSAKDSATFSPANHPNVIAVSAVADFNGLPGGGAAATCRSDQDDTLADFSNYGAVVDIAAPGVCITSTWKGNSYQTISGTSMASPHVAGAAALYALSVENPSNLTDVQEALATLKSRAVPQDAQDGFSGDKDSYAEPFLDASKF